MFKKFDEPRPRVQQWELMKKHRGGFILINHVQRYTENEEVLDFEGDLYCVCDDDGLDELHNAMHELQKAGIRAFIRTGFRDNRL